MALALVKKTQIKHLIDLTRSKMALWTLLRSLVWGLDPYRLKVQLSRIMEWHKRKAYWVMAAPLPLTLRKVICTPLRKNRYKSSKKSKWKVRPLIWLFPLTIRKSPLTWNKKSHRLKEMTFSTWLHRLKIMKSHLRHLIFRLYWFIVLHRYEMAKKDRKRYV